MLVESNTSYWVNASAGMGKTSILVKRVLSLLLSNISPSKILCITFTKAGAAEMRTRISRELLKWVFMDESSLSNHLKELLGHAPTYAEMIKSRTLFALILEEQDSLKIQTIHSFCNQTIRKFSYELGLPPNFKLLDEAGMQEIFTEAKSSLYSQVSQNEALGGALQIITKYSSEYSLGVILEELVISRYEFNETIQNSNSEDIIESLYNKFAIHEKDPSFHIKKLFQNRPDYKTHIKHLSCGTKSDQNMALMLSAFAHESNVNNDERLIEQYFSIFLTLEGECRKKLLSKQIVDKHPELAEILNIEQKNVKKIYDILKTIKLIILTSAIITFGRIFIKELNHLKMKRGFIDYDDLIVLTRNLLDNSSLKDWILYKLDYQIDHILVDEAQDTSPSQWDIIKSVTGDFFSGDSAKESDRSLFIVGDEKQSIYSFQGASHSYFNEIFEYYQNKISHSERNFVKKILVTSYRSSPSILKLVDTIFSNHSLKDKVAINVEEIIHQCHRVNDFGKVEIWPLVDEQDKRENYSQNHILAHQIVQKVRELLDRKILIKNNIIEPRDIMILVQKRSDLISDMIKIASQEMIPISGPDKLYLLDEIAIQDLISAANFALLPSDDLNLACLLRSPIIGASNEYLEKLCLERKNSLWEHIKLQSNSKACKAIYIKLKEILAAKSSPVYEFYSSILFKQNSMKAFTTRFGKEIHDVINEFLNLAIRFSEGNTDTLQIFVYWITNRSNEIKRDSSAEENKVRILTIHGAKGLQAPVVIMADTANVPSSRGEQLYIDGDIILWNGSAKYQNDFLNSKNQERKDQDYNEYIRLLYVAMTRAENYLIITGVKNSKNLDEKSWYSIIKQAISSLGPNNSAHRIIYPDGKKEEKGVIETIENGTIENSIETPNISLHEKVPEYFFSSIKDQMGAAANHSFSNPLNQENLLFSPYEGDYSLSFIKKGVIIHKILELISEIDQSQRINFIDSYLAINEISKTMADEIRNDCIRVIESYPEFFLSSLSEIKIGGNIELDGNKAVIFGRIDKIILSRDELAILDFKSTNRVPRNVSNIEARYLQQISIYKTILNSIFKRDVSSFLMWTSTGDLMKVPENMINKYLETARS